MEKVIAPGLTRLSAFSHAVVAGDFIYMAGSLGTVGETMNLMPGGTGPETAQVLDNMRRILEACGAGLDDVIKVNVYLHDMGTFSEMNDVYVTVFESSPPARITVGGVDLAWGAAVEIDCVAYRPATS